ncbi:hypothetical protein HYU82_01225 [Candidatus Saccharibacteria bacterium]|nr:hypothetical protein [Candidatus Saccharibacteria bacterium]MBI2285431.1 hypothetical protein [Candidatus Saccharibacteria bacterium]
METAANVLLIIVSAILAVFLLLLSITLIFFIKFLRKADDVANSVESAAAAFRRSATAMPWIRLITNVIARTRGRKG